MANMLPPVRGQAFTFPINLVSQADTDVFQETVTLAAGDIQVSKDGGQYANLATFPPPEIDLASGADSGTLYVTLTATEMTADVISVLFRDQAGGQWQSAQATIYTSAQTLNAIATTIGVAGAGLTAVAPIVWAEPLPGAYAAGTAGNILGNIVASLTVALTASAAFLAAIAGAVWGWGVRTLTSWAHYLVGSVRTLGTQTMSLQFCRGESYVVNMAIQYSGGGAFDLTGYDVYWALSQTRGSAALLSKNSVAGSITIVSAPDGSISFTISPTESWSLAAESYVHEVHIRQQVAPRAEHCVLHGRAVVGDSTIGIIP